MKRGIYILITFMQVAALSLFLLGLYMAYYMTTEQSPVLWPSYDEFIESIQELQPKYLELRDAIQLDDPDAERIQLDYELARSALLHTRYEQNSFARQDARMAHAHSNLEALWIVAASFILLRLSTPLWFSYLTGLSFVAGAWGHAGPLAFRKLGVAGLTPIMNLHIAEKVLTGAVVLLLFAVIWDVRRKMSASAEQKAAAA